jgi:hypothetical protein
VVRQPITPPLYLALAWRVRLSHRAPLAAAFSIPVSRLRWLVPLAAKAERLGTVEAPHEATAIEKGAAEFKVPANRLMAIRR